MPWGRAGRSHLPPPKRREHVACQRFSLQSRFLLPRAPGSVSREECKGMLCEKYGEALSGSTHGRALKAGNAFSPSLRLSSGILRMSLKAAATTGLQMPTEGERRGLPPVSAPAPLHTAVVRGAPQRSPASFCLPPGMPRQHAISASAAPMAPRGSAGATVFTRARAAGRSVVRYPRTA